LIFRRESGVPGAFTGPARAQIDQMFLFSGDGSFRSLVEAVQRRGVRVTVISTISSQPPMIADELRRQADVSPERDGLPSWIMSAERSAEL
jgi:uncharacterized LabA/DUF88 family protein